ncbi:MAG: hypothetical protein ACYS22_20685, partial [Planctomycetota bacterium]
MVNWVKVAGGKAWKLLGTPKDNMLARNLGDPAHFLMAMAYAEAPTYHPEPYVNTYLAQPLGKGVFPGGPPALAGLTPKDTLYVVGHGNAAGGVMAFKAAKKPREMFIMDPTMIAVMLADEGLPRTIKTIHAVMCFGGGVSDEALQTV